MKDTLMVMDLRDMDEIVCPDCKKPLVVLPDPTDPGMGVFKGCNCTDKPVFNIPKGTIFFGIQGGMYTLFKPKEPKV